MISLLRSIGRIKTLPLGQVLALVLLLVSLSENAFARLDPGYSVNKRPPSFSNYAPEEEEEAPADQPGFYHFYTSEYQETNDIGSRKNVAFAQICQEGYLTERIVNCIRTVITNAVELFLEEFELLLNGYILSLIVLSVTLFGGQILMGTVEKPGPEAFRLLLKIGAVLLFTNSLGGFIGYIFPVMESLASYAMSYMSGTAASPFMATCGEAAGMFDATIWGRVDCIISRLFTGYVDDNEGYKVGVLWVLAVAVFWTTFLGFFVFFFMLAVFVMMFLLVLRCVYAFLTCYAFLSLLVVISPLIIPLVLFKSTANYFNKWWRQFLSMLIQPMLLFAYMSFVFALIDSMFFKDEEYSLSQILGVNWESPEVIEGMNADTVQAKMDEYSEQYGFQEGDEEYEGYRRYLENRIQYMRIGTVLIEEEQLISIEINAASDAVSGVQDVPVVGQAVSATAGVVDAIAEWGLNKLSNTLIPFHVPRIKPEGRTRWSFMMDLLKFFLVVMVFMPLLIKYTKDLPRLIQALSSAIRTPGWALPGERHVHGSIGATVGGVKGAARGAAVGFVTGGKKGAAVGAMEGGLRGTRSGYQRGAGKIDQRSGRSGGGLAGNEHKDNIHSSSGEGTDRAVIHGAKDKSGGRLKSLGIDAAVTVATRGKGGKGAGAGKGAGKK